MFDGSPYLPANPGEVDDRVHDALDDLINSALGGGGGGGSSPESWGDPYFDSNLGEWVQRSSRGSIRRLGSGPDTPDPTVNVNPADRNNDGLDDTTNMALGVYPSKLSWTGFAYGNGVEVWPNGAPAGPNPNPPAAPAPPKASTAIVQTSDGSDVLIDTQTGQVIKVIGGPTPVKPTSSGSSGGGFTSGGGSSGGGGGSSAPVRDWAGEQAAQNAFEAAQAEANRAFQREMAAAKTEADMAIAEMNFAINLRRLGLDEKKFGVDAAETFGRLASSTDPLAFAAFLHAGGGNIMNALSTGADALSSAALLPGARALQAMRGLGSTPTGGMPTGTPPAAGGGGGTPTPTDSGAPPPATPPVVAPLGEDERRGTRFADRIGNHNATSADTSGWSVAQLQHVPGYNPNLTSGPPPPGTDVSHWNGITWVPGPAPASTTPPGGFGGVTITGGGGTGPYDPSKPAPTRTVMPTYDGPFPVNPNQTPPSPFTGSPIPTTFVPQTVVSPDGSTTIQREPGGTVSGETPFTLPPGRLPNKAVVPMYAKGTMRGLGYVNHGMMGVGDAPGPNPTANGARPEIIVNPTNAPIGVIPTPQARQMMRGLEMPRYAFGTMGGEAYQPYQNAADYAQQMGWDTYDQNGVRSSYQAPTPAYEYPYRDASYSTQPTPATSYEDEGDDDPADVGDRDDMDASVAPTPPTTTAPATTTSTTPSISDPALQPAPQPVAQPYVAPAPAQPAQPVSTMTGLTAPATWAMSQPDGTITYGSGEMPTSGTAPTPAAPAATTPTAPAMPAATTPTPAPPPPIGANVPTGGYGVTPLTDAQLGVTAGDIPGMQEVLGLRQGTQMPNLNYYDIGFNDAAPTLQQMYFSGLQGKYGIPQQDAIAEWQKYRMRGLSGGNLALGV